MAFKSGDAVEFVTNGKARQGKFVRKFYPARNAGPHYRVQMSGGMVATIFANGVVGKSMKKVPA